MLEKRSTADPFQFLPKRDKVGWFNSKVLVLKKLLSESFFRVRWKGIRPARDSTPPEGEVRKAPKIQSAAFRCDLVNSFRFGKLRSEEHSFDTGVFSGEVINLSLNYLALP